MTSAFFSAIDGAKKIRRQIRRAQSRMRDDLPKAIFKALNLIRSDAIKSVQYGTKTGRLYKVGRKTLHRASAPGQAPASNTGNLARSVVVQIDTDGRGGDVVARAEYAAALEFGTSKIAPRPFMYPAARFNRDKIVKLIRDAINNSWKRAAGI